jgi:hypothetical protein
MTPAESAPAAPGRGMRLARLGLVAVGVLVLGLGAYVLVDTVALRRLPGVALWIGAAIVLHDAVISPLVFGLGVLTRRAGHRVAGSIIVTVQVVIVLGSLLSLIVVPAIVAKDLGPKNPSILPLDYAANLGGFWLAIAVAGGALSVWLYLRTRRANQRPSATQS